MESEKDIKEQDILSKIFKKPFEYNILKSEKPDFIISYNSRANKTVNVGMEITELYYNDSSARLKNKNEYVKNVIDGEKIHKKDKGAFDVREVTYFPQGDVSKSFKTKMLFEKNYSIDDYRRAFLQTLTKKNKKRVAYQEGLEQTGLVIYDKEKHFKKLSKYDFIRFFFNENIMEEIKSSPFEEIYLITQFEGEIQEDYVRLKFCLLQNEKSRLLEYIKFNSLFKKISDIGLSLNEVFAEVLIKKGYFGVKKYLCNGIETVGCKRYSFHFNELEKNVSVFDNFPSLQPSIGEFGQEKIFFSEKSFQRYLKDSKNLFAVFDVGFESIESFGWNKGNFL